MLGGPAPNITLQVVIDELRLYEQKYTTINKNQQKETLRNTKMSTPFAFFSIGSGSIRQLSF